MSRRPPLTLHHDSSGKLIAGVGPGVGQEFVRAYFPDTHTIRIASAYFSLTGYKIGRQHTIPDVRFHVLVGKEDGGNVRKAILQEIQTELQGCEEDLWQAVSDLVQRIESGKFKICDARSMRVPFHCKFYICDQKAMWHGSANYSRNGLLHNAEQIVASSVADEISLFTQWYDAVARDAEDLLEKLLELLRMWLALSPPFDAYLKIIYLLSDLPEFQPTRGGHPPTYYQRAVVARCLRQIREFGGTLAILATGLGKTIVGAELAHLLRRGGEIDQVILLAPNAVREAWNVEMEGRGLHPPFFPTDILFRPDSPRRHHLIHQLTRRLRQAGERTLILVDEAHFYRNQLLHEKQTKRPSRVNLRLRPAVDAGAKIILLTATAYGTNSRNFDSLLYLLPHHKLDQFGLPVAWEARDPDELSRLPVVTILGLPDVLSLARRRGDTDPEDRPYIMFGDERRYLPLRVQLSPVFYELPLQSEIRDAFDASCFDHADKIPQVGYDDDLGEFNTASDAGYNTALNSWLSSPPAMEELIGHNLATRDEDQREQLSLADSPARELQPRTEEGQFELLPDVADSSARQSGWGHGKDRAPFRLGRDWREKHLIPISEKLGAAPDYKLRELIQIIQSCCVGGGKTLVFVRMHRTALYVHANVQQVLPHLAIGCSVEEHHGTPALKPRHGRDEILRRFSPRSHGERPADEFDVLICTDADGVGVNLQDADTVVNYDPPSGADVLFQRAGRVLRMTTRSDRVVRVYTMMPSTVLESTTSRVDISIRDRFRRLSRRHARSREITGSALLANTESVDLMKETSVRVEDWFREGDTASSFGDEVEHSLGAHLRILGGHIERAEALPTPIHTAKITTRFKEPRVVVFFTVDGEYHSLEFNPRHDQVREIDVRELLELARSEPDEALAPTRGEDVEAAGNRAVQLWCTAKETEISRAKKVCVIYLQPRPTTDMRQLLLPSLG